MTVQHKKPPTADDEGAQGVLSDIDQVFDDLTALAELASDRSSFYDSLLGRTVKMSDSPRGIFLTVGPAAELLVMQEFPVPVDLRSATQAECQRASVALDSNRSMIVESDRKHRTTLIAVPIRVLSRTTGVLVYIRPDNESPDVTRAFLPLLDAVSEIAAEFEKNEILRDGQRQAQQQEAVSSLSLNAHRHLNSKKAAVHLVNDARVYIGCDRVGLFAVPPRHTKLLACSGVAVADSRSSYIKMLRPLVRKSIRTGKLIVAHPAGAPEEPLLERYLSGFPPAQRPQHVAVVPLSDSVDPGRRNARPFAALVVESFEPKDEVRLFRDISDVTAHASSAMSNALRYEQIPLRWIWRSLQCLGTQLAPRHLIRTAIWTSVIAAIALFLIFGKADFRVEAKGELKPAAEHQVFASADGIVQQILVRHGDMVKRDDMLIRLQSPEMALDLKQLEGELETARQKLNGLLTLLKAADSGDPDAVIMQSRLAAQISETRSVIAGFESRLEYLQRQLETLEIRSPISGYVTTWNVQQLLTGRPVRRGESLLKIADVSGEWQMELGISDRKFGYVVQAQEAQQRSDLPVTIVLASDPGTTYESRLGDYSVASAVRKNQESSVRVTAPVTSDQFSRFKPGTSVIGRIDCGRHNVTYVWTAELVDAFRRRFF